MTQQDNALSPRTSVPSRSWWVLLFGAFIAAYYPVWKALIETWSHNADYSHGFAIVPMVAFILWQRRQAMATKAETGRAAGLILAGASLLIYLLASAGEIKTVESLSLIPFLAGTVLFLFGYSVFRMAIFPLALLIFMIPLPAQILAAATIPLQLLVTKGMAIMARAVGIPVLVHGNIILIPNHTFEVVQACSGLRSIMTLLTIGAFMGYFMLPHNWQRGLLLCAALPIAIVANMVRIFAMVGFHYYFGFDLTHGLSHTILGLAVFFLSLGLFFLIQKGLLRCNKLKAVESL